MHFLSILYYLGP